MQPLLHARCEVSALKLLPQDTLEKPDRKQRFVQEAKAASALNHPHIVTIYDIDRADDVDYIAMELIRGRTLEQLLSRGKLRLSEALKYGVQIADALAAAHAAGIVHRDLKPGNIMITERGDVKVLDFGLAKLTDPGDIAEADETRTQRAVTDNGAVVGSAPYMSPEQAEGRKVDARSDIFSFGSVLYEMLTGKRAFTGATRMVTMAAVLNQEPEPPSKLVPDLPREVERLVTRCLRKHLDRRSQSMAEIRVALHDLKEESESGSLVAQATVTTRRARWPYYAVGGVLVAAAISGAWIFGPGRPTPPLRATVLTSFVGYQGEPTLSPDGNQFAFSWDGDVPNGPLHVYVSLVGKGSPLRITPEDQYDSCPTWSPDGQSITFWRTHKGQREKELRVMPALGGPSRKVSSGILLPESFGIVSWSPDSKWLVWGQNPTGSGYRLIYAAPAAGGPTQGLTAPPPSGQPMQGYHPAISPDGREIVWVRCEVYNCELYVAGFQEGRATGALRQLTNDHKGKMSPRWTNDGREIVYLAGELDPSTDLAIYRVRASGGEPRRVEGIGTNAYGLLSVSAKGNRLLYPSSYVNVDIYRLDLKTPDATPERFLSSTRYDGDPVYSADGNRIAFASNRGASTQIWAADANGANPAPLTSLVDGVAGAPNWSPDGQLIAFNARVGGNTDIYTVPAAGGTAKRLTDYPGQDRFPLWSPDGKWIYFTSSRVNRGEIFRMRSDGGQVQQVTHDGGIKGAVTPDGQWLYYVTNNGLWKTPVAGGATSQVLPAKSMAYGFERAVAQGILFSGARQSAGYPFLLLPFSGGELRTIACLDKARSPEISPDGRWLLYVSAGDPIRETMLVDNFR